MLRSSACQFHRFSSKKAPTGTLKNLLLLMKPEWKMYSVGVVVTGVSSALALFIPQAFKNIGELQEKKFAPIGESLNEDEKA